mmetsp:Transcript_40024/g.39624  ORF Transcript_40024/g.39624 Transcript_40024/m.39624 type:complete len:358 (-) Transcript_40024:174-1247(-)
MLCFHERFDDLSENAIWIKKPVGNLQSKPKKPFVKANSRKDNNFCKTMKPSRGTQKKDAKLVGSKAQSFKKPRKHITTNLEPSNPPKTNRKQPLEKQPKQTFKLSKINSSNSLFNSSGGKSKVTPREEVFIHVESSHKTNSKLRSPNVHLKDSKKRDFSTPKGLSFGLLAKKNAKDKKMKIHKQDQFDDSPKIEARRPVRTLLDAMPSPNNFRKSQDVQVYSSFRDHTEKDPTISVHKIDPKPFESSHNLQFGKMKKEIIRITPLQERRSQTRRLRASTITREEGAKPMKNSISLVSPNVEPEDKDIVNFTAIRPEKEAIKVIEVEENEQISTYSLFTKIITGALERLGGDDQLQLA